MCPLSRKKDEDIGATCLAAAYNKQLGLEEVDLLNELITFHLIQGSERLYMFY
jgi:hypothetical protein